MSNPGCSVEDVVVDTRLSVVKPLHAKTMKKAFDFFSTSKGIKIIKSGWRASGMTPAVESARNDQLIDLLVDPFANITI